MIEIRNLSKSYGAHKVLTDIKLSFETGKVYGLVGANGAGKTTLFKCIAGWEPYQGEIQASHQPLKDYLGFLQTIPFFMKYMTGREYLQLLVNARQLPLGNMDAQNMFDLPLDQYVSTYSTGMKKKLALLGILLQKNQYFILDEPFNGVDIQSSLIIQEIIHRLKASNKTILLSSHIFATLKASCDLIFLLEGEKVSRVVYPQAFDQLESDMRKTSISNRLDHMDLG